VEIRYTRRRDCNISDLKPQEHVQRPRDTARDLQANWEMPKQTGNLLPWGSSRWEIITKNVGVVRKDPLG
jgi:hypothetical protein